jgi:hypothetical protein
MNVRSDVVFIGALMLIVTGPTHAAEQATGDGRG